MAVGFINFNQIDSVSNLGLYYFTLRSERERGREIQGQAVHKTTRKKKRKRETQATERGSKEKGNKNREYEKQRKRNADQADHI